MPRPARRPDPRALGESARRSVSASGASAQTAQLIGPVGAPRATGSRSSCSPPRHRVAFIRMTVGHGKSRFTRARRKGAVQLDELFALLSAVQDGEVSAADAIVRLERTPQWVWVAMDPEGKLLLAFDVGDRTLALAQRVVHHVTQVVAPDCAPLCLTDGFREYLTALLTHYGQWVQPPRRQAQGPAPKPRWMPLPELLYAQVIKTVRRRRLVRVRHRVVFGTLEAVQQV